MKVELAVHKNSIPLEIKPKKIHYSELTIVLKGSMEYGEESHRLLLQEGDILYLKEGSLRSRKQGKESAEYVSFNFNADREYALPSVIQGGAHRDVRYLLELFDRIDKRRYLENSAARIEHLVEMLLLSLEDEQQAKRIQPLVHKIVRYLRDHLAEKITLSMVAEHCFFSPVYCDSVFKKETGKSIIDYLLDLRAEEAKLLLMQEHYTISQVGAAVGMPDANYFARFFKKRIGCTPSEYRRKILS